MAETTTIHAQLIRYSTDGNQIIVNLKNTAADVSIDVSANNKVPAKATDLQSLVGVLGKLAFADTIADATTSASGLMTAAMVTKLNGIAAGANAYTHPNSGVAAGTYKSVTVNAQGHVTAGSNPTTLAGYGITDAASKSHTHKIADLTDNIPASKITGVLSLDNIPKSAVERVVPVKDDAARLKLTSADVQNGDVVKVTSTGKMYFVVDDTKLTTEDGYMVFSAGSAASVPWSGVTGKPTTFTPSAHTQAISTITGLQAALDNKFTTADMKAATADAAGTHGLVPAPAAGKQGQFLRGDGTWATPANTTYNVFKGATASAGGGTGLVPAPAAGKQTQFLRGDGTWATPTDTKYANATQSGAGLMSAADKTKLDAVEEWIIADSAPTKNCMWLKTS